MFSVFEFNLWLSLLLVHSRQSDLAAKHGQISTELTHIIQQAAFLHLTHKHISTIRSHNKISPPLYHRTALLKVIAAVINTTYLFFVYKSKRYFNDIRRKFTTWLLIVNGLSRFDAVGKDKFWLLLSGFVISRKETTSSLSKIVVSELPEFTTAIFNKQNESISFYRI